MSENGSYERLCPASGQACAHGTKILDRTMVIRRWLGGEPKALVCNGECAEKWARLKNRRLVGESMTEENGKKETTILFQYPQDHPAGRYQS
jgi:hypothetical protein